MLKKLLSSFGAMLLSLYLSVFIPLFNFNINWTANTRLIGIWVKYYPVFFFFSAFLGLLCGVIIWGYNRTQLFWLKDKKLYNLSLLFHLLVIVLPFLHYINMIDSFYLGKVFPSFYFYGEALFCALAVIYYSFKSLPEIAEILKKNKTAIIPFFTKPFSLWKKVFFCFFLTAFFVLNMPGATIHRYPSSDFYQWLYIWELLTSYLQIFTVKSLWSFLAGMIGAIAVYSTFITNIKYASRRNAVIVYFLPIIIASIFPIYAIQGFVVLGNAFIWAVLFITYSIYGLHKLIQKYDD